MAAEASGASADATGDKASAAGDAAGAKLAGATAFGPEKAPEPEPKKEMTEAEQESWKAYLEDSKVLQSELRINDDVKEEAVAKVDEAKDGDKVPVFDGTKLLEEATQLKEKANAEVKRCKDGEAVKFYQQGLEVLGKCSGFPMLAEESQKVTALKAVLHSNLSQCYLKLELYRRAIDSATECIKLDEKFVKAYWRRSQACEKLGEREEALRDLLAVKKLGGAGMMGGPEKLEKKCEELYEEQIKLNKEMNEVGNANEDLFKMKARFETVMEKYDLGDGHVAPLVAQWLADEPIDIFKTVEKVAKKWEMSETEAEHFTKWIKKGLDMKVIPMPKAHPRETEPPQRIRKTKAKASA